MRSLPLRAIPFRVMSSLAAACLCLVGAPARAQVEPGVEATAETAPVTVSAEFFRTHDYVERGLRIFAGTDPVMVTQLKATRQFGEVAVSAGLWHGGTHLGLESTALTTLECPSLEAAFPTELGVDVGAVWSTCFSGRDGALDSNDALVTAAHTIDLGSGLTVVPQAQLAVDPFTAVGYGMVGVSAQLESGAFTVSSLLSGGVSNASAAGFGLQDLTATVELKWAATPAMNLRAFATTAYSPLAQEQGQALVQGFGGLGVSLSM